MVSLNWQTYTIVLFAIAAAVIFFSRFKSKWLAFALIALGLIAAGSRQGFITSLVITGILIIFLFLEARFPRNAHLVYGPESLKSFAYHLFRLACDVLFNATVMKLLLPYFPETSLSLKQTHWPIWMQAFILLMAWDLQNYWLHRLYHKVPALWRFHRVHHAPTELNVFAWAPHNMLDAVVIRVPLTVLLFGLIGPDPRVFEYFYFVLFFLGAAVPHANIDFPKAKPGPPPFWSKYLMTPNNHAHHHTLEGMNTNYSFVSPVWDVIFGTFAMPEKKPTIFGIGDPEFSKLGILDQQVSVLMPEPWVRKYLIKKS